MKKAFLLAILLVPALALAQPQFPGNGGPGQGGPGNGGPGDVGPGNGGPGNGGPGADQTGPTDVKDPLCVLDCRESVHDCLSEVRAAVDACRQGCRDLVDTAHELCGADPDSAECAEARQAARDCVVGCRQDAQPEVRACLSAGKDCVADCEDIGSPRCLGTCRCEQAGCREEARAAAKLCRDGCADLRDAVRDACKADPSSDECRQARDALDECLLPCREALKEAATVCAENLRECILACEAADDDPSADGSGN